MFNIFDIGHAALDIQNISGTLSIKNTNLTSLSGFSNLQSVNSIELEYNSSLNNCALPNIDPNVSITLNNGNGDGVSCNPPTY